MMASVRRYARPMPTVSEWARPFVEDEETIESAPVYALTTRLRTPWKLLAAAAFFFVLGFKWTGGFIVAGACLLATTRSKRNGS